MYLSAKLSELRAVVTAASLDYVGSITLAQKVCLYLGLHDRQKVQVRNLRTGVSLWTYVICADAPVLEPGSTTEVVHTQAPTVCLNGAAAHHFQIGDVATVTAFAYRPLDVEAVVPRFLDLTSSFKYFSAERPTPYWAAEYMVEMATGKIHRPRVNAVFESSEDSPAIKVDQAWAENAGLTEHSEVHLVNVTNGQRDTLSLKTLAPGSKRCEIHLSGGGVKGDKSHSSANRCGYSVGDIVIVMGYGAARRQNLVDGKDIEPMKVVFPNERPCLS